MKNIKTLIIGAVVAFSMTAQAANSSATQTVDGTVDESISLDVTSANTALTLTPGATTTVGNTLTVASSNPYIITATADGEKLREADSQGYVEAGNLVDSVLQISSAAASAVGTGVATPTDITTQGVQIFSGSQAESAGTITTTVHQNTPWGTPKLPSGRSYRMVITYTATTTSI